MITSIKKTVGFLILVSIVSITSCSDDPTGPDTNPEQPGNEHEPLTELPGDPNEPAIDALFDFSAHVEVDEGEISVENGSEIIRSKIELAFVPNTTVGDINNILSKYNARIIDMLPDRPFLIVYIPDPGDLPSLRSIIEKLEGEDSIGAVWEGAVPTPDMLPHFIDATIPCAGSECVNEEQIDRIKHHLAVRGHAAWNLRNAIVNSPWLVIADFFGYGVPDSGFMGDFVNPEDFKDGKDSRHGYFVLGIINADFDQQPEVTGIFPDELRIRGVQAAKVSTVSEFENNIVRRINSIIQETGAGSDVVVNTSTGKYPSDIDDGARWWGKVATLQNNFVHFTAAGNVTEKVPENTPAYEMSSFAYAAVGNMDAPPPFLDLTDLPQFSNLENTFVVENRMPNPFFITFENAKESERVWPGCAFNESLMGGNLSAIGWQVYSFGDKDGTDGPAYNSGTSAAAPQAAGTAAYMWAVNPSLGVNEIVNLLNKAARSPEFPTFDLCRSEIPAPVIDTYDAVLAAGGDDVRKALLDVTGSGSFTEDDIEVFLDEFDERDGILDYSRYDLNGTGQTGGDATDRFDLDHDLEFGTVTQIIEDDEIEFDENAVTDTDVLCYYAYSDLYSGSSDKRKELLGFICNTGPYLEVHSSKFNYETECAYVSNINPGDVSAMVMINNSTVTGPEAPVAVTISVFEDVPLQEEWEKEISNWHGQILDHQGSWAAIGPEGGNILELKREEVTVSGHTIGIWSGRFTTQFEYDDDIYTSDSEEIITVNGEFSGLWRTTRIQEINLPGGHPPVYPDKCYN